MTTMPRVVPDQRSKFENDELFRKLGRDSEIRYTGYRDRAQEERQMRFVNSCREGHAQLSFVATGTNLHLQFYPNSWSETSDRKPTKEYVDFDKEIGKVCLKSQFILNGVCVIWKGYIDLNRLDGVGHVEFDSQRAKEEDELYRATMEQQNRRLREFEERTMLHRKEFEQQVGRERDLVEAGRVVRCSDREYLESESGCSRTDIRLVGVAGTRDLWLNRLLRLVALTADNY